MTSSAGPSRLHSWMAGEGLELGLTAHGSLTPGAWYFGIDVTAPSLHVGHAWCLTLLDRIRQGTGEACYVVLGDFTTRVGDPTGRTSERPLLREEELAYNLAAIKEQIALSFPSLEVLVNSAWLEPLPLLTYLAMAQQLRVQRLLSQETNRRRMEEGGMSLAELSYPLLQGYDFRYLREALGVTKQLAGLDQMPNVLAGLHLMQPGAAGVFIPLLENPDGSKISKSQGGLTPWWSRSMLGDADMAFLLRGRYKAVLAAFAKLWRLGDAAALERILVTRGASQHEAAGIAATEGNSVSFEGKLAEALVRYAGVKNLSAAEALIASGAARLNGAACSPKARLARGDRVSLGAMELAII